MEIQGILESPESGDNTVKRQKTENGYGRKTEEAVFE